MRQSHNILVVNLLKDSLYDESGVVCYTYGNMGEITQETRIYALPFLSQPIALSTQFTYDSWGRIQDITYPDNEVVSYGYDLGGQQVPLHSSFGQVCLRSAQMMQAPPVLSLSANSLCFVSFIFSGRRKKERNEGKTAYYGYNASNTRAYKLSMLNTSQWDSR